MRNQIELILNLHRLESFDNDGSACEELKKIKEELDPSLLRYYRRIKKRRGSGVALLQNNTCSKCRMVYPEAHPVVRFNTLVHKCEYCGRLLVSREFSEMAESRPETTDGRFSASKNIEMPAASSFARVTMNAVPVSGAAAPLPVQACENTEEEPVVLHVHGDREFGAFLKRAMEEAGLNVLEVRNVKDALRQLLSRKIDLIISELEFPNYDGFELIEAINRRQIEVPVIFVASACDEDSQIYAMGSGAFECIRESDGIEKILKIAQMALSESNRPLNENQGMERQAGILLVDQDAAVREAVRNALEPHGYKVIDASNGTEALRLISAYPPPDLIVSEVRLPDLRGTDLIKRIRARGVETEIIFLTAYETWDSNVDLMNMGAFDYIDKPVNADELLNVVRQALEGSPTNFPV